MTAGKEAAWNSRKRIAFMETCAFISMETILLKCFCDYVTLFWRVIPFVRNRCIFWCLKKTIASKQMYLFAQPEVVVSELCPVCFLKEAKHIEAG